MTSPCNFSLNFQSHIGLKLLNNNLFQILEILTHYLLRYAILRDFFFFLQNNEMSSLCFKNVDIAYLVYSHQSGGITNEH